MVNETQSVLRSYEQSQVSDFISGILNFGFFLGEMIGPPLAGLLRDNIGFENSEAIISLTLFVYIGIFVYFSRSSYKAKTEEADDNPIIKDENLPYDTVAINDSSVII